MKQGKLRTFSICLSDIKNKAADRINKSEKNGKLYINLTSWDNDEPDQFGNDFSVSISPSKEEIERKNAGEQIERIYLGNGKIHSFEAPKATQEEVDDLPF